MRAPRHWSTVRTVIDRAWHLFKRHWFALLVAAAIVETAVELIVRRNSDGAPTTSLWITVPLLAVMIVPLFWWRRFPFGAPAAVFVIGAVESFVDGRLVTFTLATFLSVLAAVFLFGILEDRRQSVAGLAIALGAAGVVTLNDPTQVVERLSPGSSCCSASPGWPDSPSGRSSSRRLPHRSGLTDSSANRRQRLGLPSPRSAPGSRASCTTSSGTA